MKTIDDLGFKTGNIKLVYGKAVIFQEELKQLIISRIKELLKKNKLIIEWEDKFPSIIPSKDSLHTISDEGYDIFVEDVFLQHKIGAIQELIGLENITEGDLSEKKEV